MDFTETVPIESSDEAHEGRHEVGLIRPATDEYDSSLQLFAADALAKDWKTFWDLIQDRDVPFLHSNDGRQPLTFSMLRSFIVSETVEVLGLKREDRLCTALPNGPEAAVAFLAFSLHGIVAPLNLALSRDEYEFEFLDLPAKALIVQAKSALRVEEDLRHSANALSMAMKVKVEKLLELTPSQDIAGLFELKGMSLKGGPMGDPTTTVKREDLALVLHTSGTTKKPKIVPLTHANIASGALCIASTVQMQPGDVCLNMMPLFHIHGLIVNILAPLVAGSQVVCLSGAFNAEAFHRALEESPQPTWYSAVPTMHLHILEVVQDMISDGASPATKLQLVRNCSAALVPSVAEAIEKTLQVVVMPTYAMTESMPIASNPRHGTRKLRSVGPKAGVDMCIMTDFPDNSILPAGIEGEVVVKEGPVTSGYEFRPHMEGDPNIEAFGDGWLRTGDKGWLDVDGYLYLSGRFKEIINRAGEKISPFEVEDVLRSHPSVQDLIAFAVPHDTLGEVVGVAVKLKEDSKLSIAELRSFAVKEGRLQNKWIPELLVKMPSIPKGPTGKPARINLAKRLAIQPLEGLCKDLTHPGF